MRRRSSPNLLHPIIPSAFPLLPTSTLGESDRRDYDHCRCTCPFGFLRDNDAHVDADQPKADKSLNESLLDPSAASNPGPRPPWMLLITPYTVLSVLGLVVSVSITRRQGSDQWGVVSWTTGETKCEPAHTPIGEGRRCFHNRHFSALLSPLSCRCLFPSLYFFLS
jgi:hypothetical protein